ncbi:hypothetical protein [Rhodohalobacter sulfatireducens]|uniref:Lipoprotein n=1 Tax=Rhodohalobacter sulfatireducens TaxID=2911366 RepID=A0ABS9KHJ7_9BACT|nr:hypothetical protein [Rhodohalobacter sulfatireducens]MCG2590327.1 hypothetical protein [Rhodohalobacter sulfatireducens]
MKFSQVIILLLIVLFTGCIANNDDSRPEFIEDLYQREQLPDSVGLEARIEIRKAQNDSIHFEFFIANEKETDQVIIHSGSFASIAIYKDSKLIFPNFDPSKIVYSDDYNESVIPAQDRIQVSTIKLRVSEFTGAKALGFAPLKIKPKHLKGTGPHNSTVSLKEYWLLTPP